MVTKRMIESTEAPAAIGPYSQAIECGNMIFLSGQLGMTTGKVFPDNTADQARQSLANIRNILDAAGYDMADVVKTTIFLTDINDFKDVNAAYSEFFSFPCPARSTVAVKELPLGAKVEIEVIASK